MLKISRLQCSFFLSLSTCLFLSTLIPITIANPTSRTCNNRLVDTARSICKDSIPISDRAQTEAVHNKYRPRLSRKSRRITIPSQGPRLSDLCCRKHCQLEDIAQICARDYMDTHKSPIDNQLYEPSSYNGVAPPNLQNLGLASTEITMGTVLCLKIAHELKARFKASPEFMARYSQHLDEIHNIVREPPRSTRHSQQDKPVPCHMSRETKHRSKKSIFRLMSATTRKPEYR